MLVMKQVINPSLEQQYYFDERTVCQRESECKRGANFPSVGVLQEPSKSVEFLMPLRSERLKSIEQITVSVQ